MGRRSPGRGEPPAVASSILLGAGALTLLGTLTYAAVRDWREREVGEEVWLAGGLVGAAIGAIALAPDGALALGLWLLVALFVVQHLLPWDAWVERYSDDLPGYLELAMYLGVGVVIAAVGFSRGVDDAGLPVAVLGVFVTVLAGRALFEARLLYGGADAKAVIVAGLILPLDASPIAHLPDSATGLLSFYPFSLTLLIDGALFGLAVPIGLLVRNLSRGTFEFPRGFTGYLLPVTELPDRFVWLRDPTFAREEEEVDTTEEDVALRRRQAAELSARGVREVWVTPQVPYVVLLAAGAFAGVLAGNLLFDLLAVL